MKHKILWLVILLETAALVAGGIFIARHMACYHDPGKPRVHMACYHDPGKPRVYYYGPRGGKYYIDASGRKKYVKAKKADKAENKLEELD